MPRRVVQMTSVHPVFDVRIYHKECRSLARAGYDVTLIAPYSGSYREHDGIKLHAVTPPRARRERLTRTVPEVYRAAVKEDADIYHFHDPELMPVAVLLKLRGKKVIYDVHEDYSSNMRKEWIPKVLQGPASLAVGVSESAMGEVCDRIVAATPKIASKFRPKITSLVQNFPWTDEFNILRGVRYSERERMVAYIGYLADVRGLKEMAQAIRLVNRDVAARLVLAGKMVGGAQAGSFLGNDEVQLLGPIERAEILELLSRARIGIVVYHPTANYFYGQPTKLLEYMAAGLPLVASDFPFYRQVIERAGCGILVDPLQPDQIAQAILWLLQNQDVAEEMGKRGQEAVLNSYNWEQESKNLLATYEAL